MILDNSGTIANSEIETRLSDISEPQKQYFVTEEIHDYFQNEFPHFTTTSIIINLFSRIEVYTRLLCKEIEIRDNTTVKFESINGSVLNRAKIYFKENNIAGYAIETHELFSNIQKIRDCFVHCNGDMEQSRDKNYLKTLIKRGKLRELNYGVSLDIDYCKTILISSKNAMIDLYNKSGFPMIIE
jgi:hypothetical protein